uniref:Uncharacterized protein n=1 Tax=Anopheles farauti TaxID=69004 RepID=A0A182QGR6_9DIPT
MTQPVSFGSSKGSMVETLVFETPTPLPEHAEREFFQSPAVLAGAGHTTVYSGGSGPPGSLSSKPQSISPPESLHLYGGQSLIQFGGGGGGGGGGGSGYDNNNSPLDTYITSAALNQQYDSLSGHQQQQQHAHFHPDHRDPNMAAVYGGTNVPPSAFNRQMRTRSVLSRISCIAAPGRIR